jgi:hypothetical protein
MVVERPGAQARTIPPIAAPPSRTPPGRGSSRRVVVDYGYRDCFADLLGAAAEPFSQAAA